MPKHILVYEINDFEEGMHFEELKNEDAIHTRVNELAQQNGSKLNIICAGFLQIEFEYIPEVSVVSYKPIRKQS